MISIGISKLRAHDEGLGAGEQFAERFPVGQERWNGLRLGRSVDGDRKV